MVEKKISVRMIYGSTNGVHVRLRRDEDDKGALFTAYLEAHDVDNTQLFVLSSEEAYTLYKILDEIRKDGNL